MNNVKRKTSGLAVPDSIGCFLGVRVQIAQKAGATRRFANVMLLSRKPYKFLCAHGRAGLDPSRFWISYDVTHCLGMRSSLKCRKVTYQMCVAHQRKWLRFLEWVWLIWMARICDFASAWPSFASASPLCSFQQDEEYLI